MPEPKTIEIDEILPADAGGDDSMSTPKPVGSDRASGPQPTSAEQPFPDLTAGLGWKTRLTLQLTQWFLFLRSKSWGKWIIGPLVVLLVVLAIPLALLAVFGLIIFSILRSFTPRQPSR